MDKLDSKNAPKKPNKRFYKIDKGFYTYHPYISFSDPNNDHFVYVKDYFDPVPVNEDTRELFRIGKEAYKRLPKVKSIDEFNNKLRPRYFKFIEKWRGILGSKRTHETLNLFFCDWEEITINWDEAQEHQILPTAWYLYSNYVDNKSVREVNKFKRAFLFYALREIDNSIGSMEMQFSGSVTAGIDANNALTNAISIELEDEKLQKVRQKMAYKAALARHKKTTHVKRKKVKEYWREYIYPQHPKLSNEKCGEWLKDTFPELSVRKLSEYVAQAKKEMKKIRPASRT